MSELKRFNVVGKYSDEETMLEYRPDGIYYDADEADKVIAHKNYKRCLAMARWCFEKSYSTTLVKYDKESGLLRNFYDWWGKRWLELAEEPTWAKFLQLIHKEEK